MIIAVDAASAKDPSKLLDAIPPVADYHLGEGLGEFIGLPNLFSDIASIWVRSTRPLEVKEQMIANFELLWDDRVLTSGSLIPP